MRKFSKVGEFSEVGYDNKDEEEAKFQERSASLLGENNDFYFGH